MDRTLVSLAVMILMTTMLHRIGALPALTENQIIEDIKFLSQSNHGAKPSRLRALLVADLKKALAVTPTYDLNCSADAELKVNTLNCTCANYSCSSKLFNSAKRSRIIITKNCEDVCCRRRYFVKKSSTHSNNLLSPLGTQRHRRPCELKNYNAFSTADNDIRIKSMALIYLATASSSLHQNEPICVGTLIHPKVVMTTLVCASMQMNDRLYVKVKENIDKFQSLYLIRNVTKRIIPDNYVESFEKFGFNLALLILDKEISMNNHEIETACLPKYQETPKNLMGKKCFVTSLENINGRILERSEAVTIFDNERCRKIYAMQRRPQIFFQKDNICAGKMNFENIKIKTNGASLICIDEEMDSDGRTRSYYYTQYGLLAWPTDRNQSPHQFTSVNSYRYWLDKHMRNIL